MNFISCQFCLRLQPLLNPLFANQLTVGFATLPRRSGEKKDEITRSSKLTCISYLQNEPDQYHLKNPLQPTRRPPDPETVPLPKHRAD